MNIEESTKKTTAASCEAAVGNLKYLQGVFLVMGIMSMIFSFLFLWLWKDDYSKAFVEENLTIALTLIAASLVFTVSSLLIPSVRVIVKAALLYIKEHETN